MIDYSKILSDTVGEIKPSGIRKFAPIAAPGYFISSVISFENSAPQNEAK